MLRFILVLGIAVSAAPLAAETEKAESCGYQADVVAAVQKSRLDAVKERDVPKAIEASSPQWPSKYNAVIPLVAPWVYELPIDQVRENDLGEVWNEMCLKQ